MNPSNIDPRVLRRIVAKHYECALEEERCRSNQNHAVVSSRRRSLFGTMLPSTFLLSSCAMLSANGSHTIPAPALPSSSTVVAVTKSSDRPTRIHRPETLSRLDHSTGTPILVPLVPTVKTVVTGTALMSSSDEKRQEAATIRQDKQPSSMTPIPTVSPVESKPFDATIDSANTRSANVIGAFNEAPEIFRFYYSLGQHRAPIINESDFELIIARAQPYSSVAVAGFADHIGTIEQNTFIAKARAAAVRDLLIRKGVPSAKIRVFFCTDCNGRDRGLHEANRSAQSTYRRVEISFHDTPARALNAAKILSRPQMS